MMKYKKKVYDNFKSKYILTNKNMSPAANNLFANETSLPNLDDKMLEDFHMYTARGLFACKHAQPDTGTAILVLTTRVRLPSVDNWQKLVRYMQYVKRT